MERETERVTMEVRRRKKCLVGSAELDPCCVCAPYGSDKCTSKHCGTARPPNPQTLPPLP